VASLDIGAHRDSPKPASAILPSVEGSLARIQALGDELRDEARLQSFADEFEAALRQSLTSGSWTEDFPGRTILRKFVGRHMARIANYEAFRNVIVAQMVDEGHEPPGMRAVLNLVLETAD
jgi:hypothetical protein